MKKSLQLHKPQSFKMTGVVLVPRELWQKCMDILQDELPSQQFNTWLRPLKVMADQDELCLLAPNRFVLDWVKDKYLPRIEEIFMEFSDGNPPAIALGVSNRRPSFGFRSSGFGSGRSGINRRASKDADATANPAMLSGSFDFDEGKGQTNLDLYSQPPVSPEGKGSVGVDFDKQNIAGEPVESSPVESSPVESSLVESESALAKPLVVDSTEVDSVEIDSIKIDLLKKSTAATEITPEQSSESAPAPRFVNPLKNKRLQPVKVAASSAVSKRRPVSIHSPVPGSTTVFESSTVLGSGAALETAVIELEGAESDQGQTVQSVPEREPEPELESDIESVFEYPDDAGFAQHGLEGEDGSGIIMPTNRNVEVEGSTRHSNSLNRGFVFESFVEGKSNQLALAAARQVAENPGNAYNPLFLYGGVGLGKTHLMHAIGNQLARQNPDAKIIYLHSERFVADMVKALQLNAINDFKRYYRSVDALLIDDIQFFAGKERSQEEFFHTFNALLEGGQQMILTCDRYPKEIGGLEERLKSRFGWGLTVAVEPPELETRVAILMKKAEQAKIELPHESAFFIAQRIRSNVRELEGALKRVIANAHFMGRRIDIDLIRESLKDLLALQDKQVSIENIQRMVAEYYKIKISEIMSKRRTRTFARPRQLAMALSKELTSHSLPEIGNAYGGRDHTTVLHACRKVKELCRDDAEIEEDYKNLLRLLTN